MRGSKIKILILVALIIITFLSMNLMSVTVKIEGKGRGTTIYNDNGTWDFKCDNSTSKSCTLTVIIPEQ